MQQQHVAVERDCDSILAQQRRFFDEIRRKQLEVRAAMHRWDRVHVFCQMEDKARELLNYEEIVDKALQVLPVMRVLCACMD